jgi:chromate transporter
LIALSWVYIVFGDVPWVEGLFYGIKPAVTAIVIQAAYRIGSKALATPALWAIAAASFVAIFSLNLPFPFIVLAAAVIGWVGGRISPATFKTGAPLIDDHTPAPQHVQFNWQRMCLVLVVGGLLWVLPMGFLVLSFGGEHTLTQMGWFFTKAALLTFGGAYAVLPYVYQGAVEQFGWVTATQMMDGLALGETTPGPLIMVVTFVGFIGGYAKAVLGPDSLFWSGVLAATLVTWFTFLPSFIFILAGGPLVESTKNDLKFTAPLVAITAAVVGVILNLALFFGYQVLWPSGLSGHLDMFAAAVALFAAIALFKFKLNVIYVIAACGLTGVAYRLIM